MRPSVYFAIIGGAKRSFAESEPPGRGGKRGGGNAVAVLGQFFQVTNGSSSSGVVSSALSNGIGTIGTETVASNDLVTLNDPREYRGGTNSTSPGRKLQTCAYKHESKLFDNC